MLDGVIEFGEWSDASAYELELEDGTQTLHLKHYDLGGGLEGECSIYEDNPSYTLPCGRYLMIAASGSGTGYLYLWLDEGDDGAWGSGSGDQQLVDHQEDWKELVSGDYHWSVHCHEYWGLSEGCPEPYCRPWDDADCWRCSANHDGGVAGDDCVWSDDPGQVTATLSGDRQRMADGFFQEWPEIGESWFLIGQALPELRATINMLGFFSADYDQAELFIPFEGLDLDDNASCEPEPCDLSDAVFEPGDVLGLRLITSLGTCPADADLWDASTWTSLTLGSI